MKHSLLKASLISAVVAVSAGCASNSDVESLRGEISKAQQTADQALSAAQAAQQTADAARSAAADAKATADAAKQSADDANTKIDRSFKKAMYK